jgi:hypothetical protein
VGAAADGPVANTVRVGGRYVRKQKACYELRGVRFKSRYEYNYAVFCDYLGIAWQYEPRRFGFPIRRSVTSYRLDFYLPALDEFVECKGYWDRRSRVQQKRMRIHHPCMCILIIDEPFFRSVEKQRLCKVIPGWRCTHTEGGSHA